MPKLPEFRHSPPLLRPHLSTPIASAIDSASPPQAASSSRHPISGTPRANRHLPFLPSSLFLLTSSFVPLPFPKSSSANCGPLSTKSVSPSPASFSRCSTASSGPRRTQRDQPSPRLRLTWLGHKVGQVGAFAEPSRISTNSCTLANLRDLAVAGLTAEAAERGCAWLKGQLPGPEY
jgi:hypothetical protein